MKNLSEARVWKSLGTVFLTVWFYTNVSSAASETKVLANYVLCSAHAEGKVWDKNQVYFRFYAPVTKDGTFEIDLTYKAFNSDGDLKDRPFKARGKVVSNSFGEEDIEGAMEIFNPFTSVIESRSTSGQLFDGVAYWKEEAIGLMKQPGDRQDVHSVSWFCSLLVSSEENKNF